MTTPSTATARPKGPDAVRRALLAATEELCADYPPGSVTVRSIAAAAGVNHGLVHHYFESKQALLGAAMERIEGEFLESVADMDATAEAVATFFDLLCQRPTYPRLLSWMLLEGVEPTDHIDRFPLVTRLVDLVRRDTTLTDARLRIQSLLAFVAGWATSADFMADAAGLDTSERTQSQRLGRRVAVAIATGEIP